LAMPPKRGASSGPSAKDRQSSRGAAKGKAKAKAKAAAAPAPDPRAELEQEAVHIFEKQQPDGDLKGVIKLAQFAEVIRSMNIRKCMLWGDDPVHIIKREWSKVGGAASREVSLEQFKAWWPDFAEAASAEAAEKAAAEEASKLQEAQEKEAKYGHDGVWQIKIKELLEAVEEARKKGKTPLIIDNTPGFRAETFFQYRDTHIIECKKMIVDKAKGTSVEDILEEERRRLWDSRSFKFGKAVMFRLANTACDLNGMFNSESFPVTALLDATEVQKVSGSENVPNMKTSPFIKMASDRDEALELEANGFHEAFNVLVVTQFTEEDYVEFLKDQIPLHLMQPMKPSVD